MIGDLSKTRKFSVIAHINQGKSTRAEVLGTSSDRLKSLSRGYASFDYEFSDFQESDLVRLDILINEETEGPLFIIFHRDQAYERGKELVHRIQDIISRQTFEVVI